MEVVGCHLQHPLRHMDVPAAQGKLVEQPLVVQKKSAGAEQAGCGTGHVGGITGHTGGTGDTGGGSVDHTCHWPLL